MLRLDRIEILGYRSVRLQAVDLRSFNLLIGSNGSGKSNFLGVFRLLNELSSERLQKYVQTNGGANQILYLGRKVTEELSISLWFDEAGYLCRLVPTESDSLIIDEEIITGPLQKAQPGDGERRIDQKETRLNEGFTFSPVRKQARSIAEALQTWRVYHFNDTSATSAIKQTSDLHDNRYLRSDAGNLAAFLYRLQETQPQVFLNLTSVIRMVAPFFGSFRLQPDRLNPEKIRLEWEERGSDAYFNANSLSDGTLRFICLATLLLQPDLPSTILVDEPELGLHPFAINVLADLLRSTATRTQVIVSTQSVTLVTAVQERRELTGKVA